jgi:enamine deaminase RidA (YjgF/YER057c/UK114 family)
LANIVRLDCYTASIPAFKDAVPILGSRLEAAGCKPASTLLEVNGLFHPDLMIEIMATAVF